MLSPNADPAESKDQDDPCCEVFCSLCFHKMDSTLYKIHEHPLTGTALCILCFEEIAETLEQDKENENEKEESSTHIGGSSSSSGEEREHDSDSVDDEESDRCDWCFDDDDRLLYQCDTEGCTHQFCRECLVFNLGEEYVAEEVDAKEQWFCLCCDPRPLQTLREKCQQTMQNSIYETISFTPEDLLAMNEQQSDEEETVPTEKDCEIEKYIQIAQNLYKGANVLAPLLTDEHLDMKEMEFRNELREKHHGSISKECLERRRLYGLAVRRTIDIYQRQESECTDILATLGVSGAEISALFHKEQQEEISDRDRFFYGNVDNKVPRDVSSKPSPAVPAQSRENLRTFREDPSVKEAKNLADLTERANADDIVREYAGEPLPHHFYPAEFRKILPENVLSALNRASRREIETLTERFKIPKFVSIIMAHATKSNPTDSKYLLQLDFHPAIIKAIFYEDSPENQMELCVHYDLDPELFAFTDVGSARALFDTFQRRREENGKSAEISFSDYKDYVDNHDEHLRTVAEKLKNRRRVAASGESSKLIELERLVSLPVVDECADEDEVLNEYEHSLKKTVRDVSRFIKRHRSSHTTHHDTSVRDPLSTIRESFAKIATEEPEGQECMDVDDSSDDVPRDSEFKEPVPKPSNHPKTEVIVVEKPIESPTRHKAEDLEEQGGMTIDDVLDDISEDSELSGGLEKLSSPLRNRTDPQRIVKEEIAKPNCEKKRNDVSSSSRFQGEIIDLVSTDDDNDDDNIDEDDNSFIMRVAFQTPSSKQGRPSITAGTGGPSSSSNRSLAQPKLPFTPNAKERELNLETKKMKNAEIISRFFSDNGGESVVLNVKKPKDDPEVAVVNSFVGKLKPHQIEGLQFIWNSIAVSFSHLKKASDKKTGCLLAHCMGLGKSFTTLAFVVTMLTNPLITAISDPSCTDPTSTTPISSLKKQSTNSKGEESSSSQASVVLGSELKKLFHRVLIIAPKNTLQNWEAEFIKWTPRDLLKSRVAVYVLTGIESATERLSRTKQWFEKGGVLIMSYEMLRSRVKDPEEGKKASEEDDLYCSYLLNPGADLVIADEAHSIKNNKSQVTHCFNRIRTRRRIALTGSPLQNNLREYWCMVNWIRERHLPALPTFNQRFAKPIEEGQNKNANHAQRRTMKFRTHVLHKLLKDIVHRKDMSELVTCLKPKREFVLSLKMSNYQKFLYETLTTLLKHLREGRFLFKAYQSLLRVFNHPLCAVLHFLLENEKNSKQETGLSSEKAPKPGRGRPSGASKKEKEQLKPTLSMMCRELESSYAIFSSQSAAELEEVKEKARIFTSNVMADDDEKARSDDDGLEEAQESSSFSPDDAEDHGILVDEDMDMWVDGDDNEDLDNGEEKKINETDSREDNKGEGAPSPALVTDEEEHCVGRKRPADDPLDNFAKRICSTDSLAISAEIDSLLLKENAESPLPLDPLPRSVSPAFEDDGKCAVNEEEDVDIISPDWWRLKSRVSSPRSPPTATLSDLQVLELSSKMTALFSLLALSVKAGDKMIVFSQSLKTLDVIELLLQSTDWGDVICREESSSSSSSAQAMQFSRWSPKSDYVRIDGSTLNRLKVINEFNQTKNVKLILISTRAGNMGINLQAANRVVLFDTSWNPAHDLQAIYRSYRFGQEKNVFVYRLIASGSIEEKIYKRQVQKLALANRVIDAQTPDSIFTSEEQAELLNFTDTNSKADLEKARQVVMSGTNDKVLWEFIEKHGGLLEYIEDNDSLLQHNEDEKLNAEEEKEAEAMYEKEKQAQEIYERSAVPENPSVPFGAPPGQMIPGAPFGAFPSQQMAASSFNTPPIQMTASGAPSSEPPAQMINAAQQQLLSENIDDASSDEEAAL